jgi:hypothetical protein
VPGFCVAAFVFASAIFGLFGRLGFPAVLFLVALAFFVTVRMRAASLDVISSWARALFACERNV